MNKHLRIIASGERWPSSDGWRVEHAPTQRTVATFRTEAAARKFYGEIAGLDWNFKNPLKCPNLTWLGVRDVLARRGVKLTPDWTLEVVDAC